MCSMKKALDAMFGQLLLKLQVSFVPNGVLKTEYLNTSPLLRELLTTSAGCQKHELREVIGWRPT